MKRFALCLFTLVIFAAAASAQTFTFNDLLSTRRVSDPQLSPNGKHVLYTVGTVDRTGNRVINHIFRVNVDGSEIRQLTNGDRSHGSPRWSPDGEHIAYTT